VVRGCAQPSPSTFRDVSVIPVCPAPVYVSPAP
jgi:hypothetical protein